MAFSTARYLFLFLLVTLVACNPAHKKRGNSISYNIGGEPTTLNPLSGADAYTSAVHAYVFETLLENDDETYEWKPVLATEWSISDDQRTFEFKLREGVKWQDGTEFTAEDVKYSYDVIYTEDFKAVQLRPYYDAIESVEILDKYRVRFKVKDDYFQNFDVVATLKIIPKHYYSNKENKKKFNKFIIGTGPYEVEKYERGQKIVLVHNPGWWGREVESEKDTHQIKKINLRMVGEENVALELLKRGDIDFQGFRPEGFMKKTVGPIWDKKIVKVKTENKSAKGFGFIGFNLKHPVLKDREVRKALSMLFNRPLMLQKFEYNLSELATGPTYRQSDYSSPEVKPTPFDPKGALKVLRDSGWKDSDKDGVLDKVINGKRTPLSITIMEPNPDYMKYLTIYKEDAAKVGVDINIKGIEWNSFVKLLDERNFEAVRLAWTGQIEWDPKQIWHSDSIAGAGSNFISYSNPKVDQMIDKARKIYDREERVKILRNVYEEIADDYPYLWWFNPRYTLYGHTKRIVKPKETFKYSIGQQYWKIKED
ncbi:MAG: ABC transporter substrate-binding protein [Bacteriovoracia bacterium]